MTFIQELDAAIRKAGLTQKDVSKLLGPASIWPEDPTDKLIREGMAADAVKAAEDMGARRNEQGRWIKHKRAHSYIHHEND